MTGSQLADGHGNVQTAKQLEQSPMKQSGGTNLNGTVQGQARPQQPAASPKQQQQEQPRSPQQQADGAAAAAMAAPKQQQPQQPPRRPLRVVPVALPNGPFARILQHEGWHLLLCTRLKYVLAAAMAVHGALATREPAGQGSGHLLAWRLTANFLGALLPASGVSCLSAAARVYAAAAVAEVNAQLHRQLQHLQRHPQQQQQPQHSKQQQQQGPGGPEPMQVDAGGAAQRFSRPLQQRPQQQPPAQPPQQQHYSPAAYAGLVGAAKRKSSKPRSTQEALAAAAPAAGTGRRGTAAGAGEGRALRPRRRHQPGPQEAQPATGQRSSDNGRSRSPGLADILLPPEPLPRWGRQLPRPGGSANGTLVSVGVEASQAQGGWVVGSG